VLLGLLIVLTLLAPFLIPASVKEWARQVDYNPLRLLCNDDRIAAYRNSLNMIRAHPVIGVGTGAFMKSYKYYKEFPEYRGVITPGEMKAHNNFLHMAAEVGLLGLGIFLWLLYRLFREADRVYRALSDNYLKVAALSCAVCLVSFLVNGLTESSLFYSRVAILFWYVAGLLLAFRNTHSSWNFSQ